MLTPRFDEGSEDKLQRINLMEKNDINACEVAVMNPESMATQQSPCQLASEHEAVGECGGCVCSWLHWDLRSLGPTSGLPIIIARTFWRDS